MRIRLLHGDCLDRLAEMEPDSIDACVCDPPYGLSAPPDIAVVLQAWLAEQAYHHGGRGFMGRTWDAFVPGPRYFAALYRVLKPGAHAVVFAGQRTVDLMGISLRLAGFEIRDLGGWAYWSGFPKSLDISKEIDRLAGAEREVVGRKPDQRYASAAHGQTSSPMGRLSATPGDWEAAGNVTAPATPEAQQWAGFGTATKPCFEPWYLVRKPISEKSIARNVLRWGTGALNLDACRFAPGDPMWVGPGSRDTARTASVHGGAFGDDIQRMQGYRPGWVRAREDAPRINGAHALGRFPANLLYCPKASRAERERGCEHLPKVTGAIAVERDEESAGIRNPRAGAGRTADEGIANHHPTVKSIGLLRWLCRLVTPPGGRIVDPYMGSGSCGVAAALEGFAYTGIELDTWDDNDPRARGGATYIQIARARIEHATSGRWVAAPEASKVDDTRPQVGLFG